VTELRNAILKTLGDDRGSMILRRQRAAFDGLVAAHRGKLDRIRRAIEADIDEALAIGRAVWQKKKSLV
jgi:hypothetical protein